MVGSSLSSEMCLASRQVRILDQELDRRSRFSVGSTIPAQPAERTQRDRHWILNQDGAERTAKHNHAAVGCSTGRDFPPRASIREDATDRRHQPDQGCRNPRRAPIFSTSRVAAALGRTSGLASGRWKLRIRIREEQIIREMTIEGVISILEGMNPRMLEEKLLGFLTHAGGSAVPEGPT